MRLTYSLTPADYLAAVGGRVADADSRPAKSWLAGLIAGGFSFGLPWVLSFMSVDPHPAHDVWPAVACAAVVGVVAAAATWLAARLTGRPTDAARPRRSAAHVLCVGLVAAAEVMTFGFTEWPVAWSHMLVTLAPTQAAAIVAGVWLALAARRARRHTAPVPSRDIIVDMTEAGLRVGDRASHPWPTLHDAIERPTVLVLFTGQEKDPLIIPRRAFASPADDRGFRDLLRSHRAYRPATSAAARA